MINCCKDCKERYASCHVFCPTYIRENEKHQKLREKIHKEKEEESYFKSAAYRRQRFKKDWSKF